MSELLVVILAPWLAIIVQSILIRKQRLRIEGLSKSHDVGVRRRDSLEHALIEQGKRLDKLEGGGA